MDDASCLSWLYFLLLYGLLAFLLTRFFLFVRNFAIWPYVERKGKQRKKYYVNELPLSRAVQWQLIYNQEIRFFIWHVCVNSYDNNITM